MLEINGEQMEITKKLANLKETTNYHFFQTNRWDEIITDHIKKAAKKNLQKILLKI